METIFQRARKFIAFLLVLSMNQMILGPIFILDTYAASASITIDAVNLTLLTDINGSGANIGDTIHVDTTVSNTDNVANGDCTTAAPAVTVDLQKYGGSASETLGLTTCNTGTGDVWGLDFIILAAPINGIEVGAGDVSSQVTVSATDSDDITPVTGASNSLAAPVDSKVPVLTLIGTSPVDVTQGSVYVDSGATAVDNSIDISNLILTGGTFVDTSSVGTGFTITYDVTDTAGNVATQLVRTINVSSTPVADTTPPVVTIVGDNPQALLVGDTFVDSGATWTDDVDGSGVIAAYNSGTLNTSATGSYSLEYFYVDAAGNTGSALRTVNVVDVIPPDTTAPVVTLVGSGTVDILSGATWNDPGATWTDNVDGSGTIATASSGTVNTALTGSYILEYIYVDVAGNTGSTTRTVNVVDTLPADTTPPVVTIVGDNPQALLVGDTFVDSGATWTDDVDGSGVIAAYNSGTLNTSATGSYSLEYFYVDAAGNTGSAIRTVNVTDTPDTTPPTATVEYSNTGATNQPVVATLTGASEPITITNNSGSNTYTFTTNGSFTFVYQDAAGNTGSTTATVANIDLVAPSAIIDYTPSTTTSGAVIATLTGALENITITNNSGSNQYIFTDTGSFTFDYVDDAGNTGSTTATVTWIDTTPPTAIVEYSTTSPTNGVVVATLTGASESITITNNSGDTTYTFVSNGTFTFEFEDVVGNTGSVTATVSNIDLITPVVTLNGSGVENLYQNDTWTDLGATWTDNVDGSGTITNGTGLVNTTLTGTYSVNYIYVDAAGNTGSTTRTVNVLDIPDTTPPTAVVEYSNTGATNQPVVATLTGASEPITITNNSGSSTYIFTDNGSFTFDFVDNAGNTGSAISNVSNIDLIVPTATVDYSPSTTTSGAVIAILTGATENITITNNSGSNQYIFTDTGSFTFDYVDDAGNTGSTTATVTWIDLIPPTATVEYSNTNPTNQNVVVTLTGASEPITITNNSGSNTYTFTTNGTFTFEFEDAVGNTGSTTATVGNIDTTVPVVTLNGSGVENLYQNDTWTDLGATWTDNVDGSGTIANGTGLVNTTLTGTYSVNYIYVDAAGNTGSTTRTVNVLDIPDTTPPTAVVEYSNTGATNQPVVATLTGASESITITNNSGSSSYIFSSNGSFTFDFVDVAGNTGSAIATVNNIDTTLPVVTLVGSGTEMIFVGDTWVDSGATWTDNVDGSGVITNGAGLVNTSLTGTYTVDYIYTDTAGNSGSVTRTVIVLDTPDTIPPVLTLSGSTPLTISQGSIYVDAGAICTDNIACGAITVSGSVDTMTIGTYTLTYSAQDISGNPATPITRVVNVVDTTVPVVTLNGSGVENLYQNDTWTDLGATWTDNVDGSGTITNGTGLVNTTLTGTYSVNYIYVDAAGNTGSTTRTVNVLDIPDTTPPTAVVEYSNTGATNQPVVATLTGASEAITITNNSGSNQYTFTTNGSFTFDYQDAAGNTGSTVATVTWIDVIVPTATVEYSTTGATNQPVVATLTGVSEPITITNNSGSSTYAFATNGSFTFDFVDAVGNTGSTTATVGNIDTTAPVVTLSGSSPEIVAHGSIYADAGATWTDNVDGSGTIATASSGAVNTSQTGIYLLQYTYTDTAGNTGSAIRTVTVTDQTAPVITLSGSTPITVAHGSIYVDAGATCVDNVDVTCTVTVSGTVNTAATGTYILTYSAVDIASNVATPLTRTVNVIDLTAPVIALVGASSLTVAYGSVYTDSGATCTDNLDLTCTVIATGSVNTSQTGTYTLIYNATDLAGNTATPVTRTVNVTDLTAPVVTLIGSGTLTLTQGATWSDPGATWSDNLDGTGSLTGATSGAVNTAVIGSYTLTYVYTDLAGNIGSVTRIVNVVAVPTPISRVGPGGGGGSSPLFNYLGNLLFFFPTKTPPVYTGTTILLDLIKVPVQYRNAIRILKNKNVLPDFNLNGKMTRIEFVRILALLQGYKEVTVEKVFADVNSDSEIGKYVSFGVANGWLNTKNKNFRPDDFITFGEATKILGTIVGTTHAESRAAGNTTITRARAIDLIVGTLGIK